MTLTVPWGFNDQSSEGGFARWAAAFGEVGYKHGLLRGLVPSPGPGALQVALTADALAVVTGALVVGDEDTELITHAVGDAAARIDWGVLEVEWSGTGTARVIPVKGSSTTTLPGLTQDPAIGVERWRMPLYRVTVPAGHNGVFTSGQIERCAPLPGNRRPEPFRGSDITADNIARTSSGKVVSSVTATDPGRPYYLRIRGDLRVAGDAGYARLSVRLDGAEIAYNFSPGMTLDNGSQPTQVETVTGPISDRKAVVQLHVAPDSMNAGSLSWGGGGNNKLTVEQIYL